MGTQSQSASQGGKADPTGRAVRAALGIDIGGTGIKGAPVDLGAGTLMAERYRLDTPHPAKPGAVAKVVGEVARHFDWSGPVGVTFPGVILDGVIQTAANMDPEWVGQNGAEIFAPELGPGPAPVLINDADAAGLAEVTHGAGRERNGVALMLTFGTGIGSALFLDGRVLPNTELGHLEIRGKDAEHRASAKVREDKDLSWHEWAERVQEYLERVEALLAPDLMIIGGGISKHPEKFLPLLSLRAHVVAAEMANNAGIIGAALAAGARTGNSASIRIG